MNSEHEWTSVVPFGDGPHTARLRGGNIVTVEYKLRGNRWSWICDRTKRRVCPIAWRNDIIATEVDTLSIVGAGISSNGNRYD